MVVVLPPNSAGPPRSKRSPGSLGGDYRGHLLEVPGAEGAPGQNITANGPLEGGAERMKECGFMEHLHSSNPGGNSRLEQSPGSKDQGSSCNSSSPQQP